MRWISSSSSDVISFYSLPDGVQHVLPALFDVRRVEASKCSTSPSSASTSEAQISSYLQRQKGLQNAHTGLRRAASSNAGIEQNSQQTGSACAGFAALPSDVSSSNPSLRREYFQASKQALQVEGEVSVRGSVYTHCSEGYHNTDILPQQSLGYVTTCIFSGGWGGYDETEVTAGTTEGYVYALPALWPPLAPGSCEEARSWGEGGSLRICKNCGSSPPAVAIHRSAIDAGESAPLLCAACKAAVGGGGTASDGGPSREELEETSSLAFPTSYVATPVKRFFCLPYTVQHLQMLGTHTPALAGEYHDELLWMQQEHRRHRTPAARVYGLETHGSNQSETKELYSCTRTNSRRHEDCKSPSCLDCVSCCCGRSPLLSVCTPSQCCSFPFSNCSAGSSRSLSSPSASAALRAPTYASQRSYHLANRVQKFFSSDRLLLALDKGGNGVVAHWPEPPYLQDRLPATRSSTSRGWAADATSAPDYEYFSKGSAARISPPLAGSFSLNLSLQCCASNPVITPLLAVVPCVVAAGGLRLLSVYDLVTSSFVFYARPPILPSRLARQHRRHSPQHASAKDPWIRRGSRSQQTGLVWSNMCCLSRSSGIVADGTQPAGSSRGPCLSRPYNAGAAGHGLPAASSAAAGRNIPISISSLTWLPALHPLLLGASTESGFLLLYDLRASPHPVFCATRPSSAGANRSAIMPAPGSRKRTQTASSPHCFHGGVRETCKSRQTIKTAASSELRPVAVEAASIAGALPPVAVESTVEAPSSKCIEIKPLAGRMEDRRNSGKEIEEKGANRRVRRSSSRCSGEKGRKRHSEKRRGNGKKFGEDKSMSISFLATPAWLTSAAVSHDAAILPCGCRCCQARAAEFSKADAPSCVQSAISTAFPLTKRHRQELIEGDPITLLEAKTESALKRQCSRSCGPMDDDHQYKALPYTHSQKQLDGVASSDVTDKEEVSFFGGCAATVVIKPRNSTRPRPRLRKRVRGRRESFHHLSRREKIGIQRFGCDASAESTPTGQHCNSNKLSKDGFSCKGALDNGGSAAEFTQHCDGAAGAVRRRKRRTFRQRHDTSWRRRWFARQEKALVTFFTETYTTLLSKRLRKGETAVAASVEAEPSTPTRAADMSTFISSEQRCTLHSSVSGATEPAMSGLSPVVSYAVSGNRAPKRNLELMCSGGGVPSSSMLLLSDTDVQTTRSEDVGAVSAIPCGSCEVAPRLRGRPIHSEQHSEVSSCLLHISSCYVPTVTNTSTELPFYLLRLASSPCSVLTGFPSTRGGSKQKTFERSCCPLARHPLRLVDISIPFIASSFFSLFARLLYAHRLDQHVVARRLSYHEERQVLKILHAADCSERALVSPGPSAVDAAIAAVDAAEAAAAEANSAEVDARAAGVAVAEPASAAAVASDIVEPDASKISDLWMSPSHVSVPGKRKLLHAGARTEDSNDAIAGKLAVQDVSVSSFCGASSNILSSALPTPAPSKAPVAPEKKAPLLLNFEKNLLSLYTNLLLVDRKGRAVQRTTPMASLRDSIVRALPDMFSRHAQNCMQLLHYAAAVLYAFGDAAPVLAKKSGAAEKAVQAAAACALGLESEKCLSSLFSPTSGVSPGLWTDGQGARVSSTDCAAAQGVRPATSKREGIGVQNANGEEKRNDERQLRCGCGRVEAAVKAKARRWLADEFVTEVRLAMRDTFSERSASLVGREKTSISPVTWEKGPRLEETDWTTAEECAGVEQVVAATRVVASSMCLCELFQSATFFPILFFNVFRRLLDRVSEAPFCIQRNCIRSLPVSDIIYQRLARSQLRMLTRSLCKAQRGFTIQSAVRQTECPANDVAGVPIGKVCAATTFKASSTNCSERACCGSCTRARSLTDRTDAAKYADGSDRPSHERINKQNKEQKRTQQLFCLDERGRVRVLSISLRLVVDSLCGHDSGGDGRVKFANNDACGVPNADRSMDLGFACRWNQEHRQEDIDDSLSPRQGETVSKHTPAFPGTIVQSTGDKRAQNGYIVDERKDTDMQQSNFAGCSSSRLACSMQKFSERPSHLQHITPSISSVNSSMSQRVFCELEGGKELLSVDKDEQECFCLSDLESAVQNRHLQRKMWKEQWLRRRRRSEWCGACMVVKTGAFPAATSGYMFSDNVESSVNFEASQAGLSKVADHIVCAEAADISEESRKARHGRGRTPVAPRGMGRARKGGKHSVRLLNEVDRSAIIERVARTAATTWFAQINANVSLLRLFPLLPLWNSLKPRRLWHMSSRLHKGRCTLRCFPFRLSRTKKYSCDNHSGSPRQIGSGSVKASETEESCKAPCFFPAAGGLSDVLTHAARLTCFASRDASVAQRLGMLAEKPKEEGRRLVCPVAEKRKVEASIRRRIGEECSEYCRHLCCRFHVEEEAFFEVNGKNTHGHLESDSRRSRLMSLAIHENGRYVLAATCAPSFLLYSSSSMDLLPPYEPRDRLLFGCATGTVPPFRAFRFLSAHRDAHFSSTASMCRCCQNVPTFHLPDAPPGPRPPPPVLISASPILPPTAAAPFLPHTLLRGYADHDVAYGVSYNRSASMRRLARCRPRASTSLRRQNVLAVYGPGGTRGQAIFSDWLTDEEDEREMQAGAGGSETGSVSDT